MTAPEGLFGELMMSNLLFIRHHALDIGGRQAKPFILAGHDRDAFADRDS